RLRKMHSEFEQLQEEPSELLRHSLALALQELQRLATRIPEVRPGKEEHVESESTNHDSGTACAGSEETRDRGGAGVLSSTCTQGPQSHRRAGPGVAGCGESRTLPKTDPGVVAARKRDFCAGP